MTQLVQSWTPLKTGVSNISIYSRRAERLDVGLVEDDPFLGHAVHVGGDDVRIVEPDVVPSCTTRRNATHFTVRGLQEEGGDDVRIVEPDVVPSCTTRHLIKQCLTLRGARRRGR